MKMLSQIRIRCLEKVLFFQFHTSMRSRLARALAAKSIFLNLKQLLLSSFHLQQGIERFQTQRRESWVLVGTSVQIPCRCFLSQADIAWSLASARVGQQQLEVSPLAPSSRQHYSVNSLGTISA